MTQNNTNILSYYSGGQKSEHSHRGKIKVSAELCFFLGKNKCFGLFQLLEVSYISCSFLSSIFKAQQCLVVPFLHGITLIWFLYIPSSTHKDTCDDIEPILIIQNNLYISRPFATLFPSTALIIIYNLTYSQVLGITILTSLVGIILSATVYNPQNK